MNFKLMDLHGDGAVDRFRRIFLPNYVRRVSALNAQSRFAYYTSAETAFKILQSREIWMRMAITMNDYSEVQHGMNCIRDAWTEGSEQVLKEALDEVGSGLFDQITTQYDQAEAQVRLGSFVTCFSEHRSTEDETGRLSMWRAYGRGSGVALVFNASAFMTEDLEIGISASPVLYGDAAEVGRLFSEIATLIRKNSDWLRQQPPEEVVGWMGAALHYGALSLKHKGFSEELEWRVVHTENRDSSSGVTPDVQIIGGIPQPIMKISLNANTPDGSPSFHSLERVFDRVIIGPSEDQVAVHQAIVRILWTQGFRDFGQRVKISGIPLRA